MLSALLGFPLILIVGLVLLTLLGTNEPDDLRERPAMLYLSFMTLTGVLLLLFATVLAMTGLLHLTATHSGALNHDADVSQVVVGGIAGAAALAVLRFHVPKLELGAEESAGPARRIFSRVVYVVCAAAALTGLAAAAGCLYAIYGMVAPDTAGVGHTVDAVRSFIAAAVVAGVAALVFARAWRRVEQPMVRRPTPAEGPAE
ncbi:MAG TPA: hypothetical protein VHD87_09385 [Acidimicrobiales bacterium]|nr:hypothetical protein [Acidimicrobiales bacterium]